MQRAQQLGRYHLLDRIAFGGMAEIYRAKTFDEDGHVHLVAVKRILSHLAADDDFIQMLIDEARVASLLDHRNIAKVYEFARSHDEFFIAMEFVDGKDLRSIIDRTKKNVARSIPPEHVAYIGAEIALGLHAAHDSRDGSGAATALVHRDVSPSNVICAYNGEVKLCDFGIAKTTLSTVKTKTGIIKGKVKYMSPEQALGRKLDHRSDIFSLGSVLYEMLTRSPPFQAPSEMELILRVRDAQVVPVRALAPQVPDGLARIVERCLSKKKEDRYKSGEELAAALRGFLLTIARGYTRSTLGRFLRKLFEKDIERELRLLEEYVLVAGATHDVGVNLIADTLGPRAAYKKFTPERKTFDVTGPATISEVAVFGDDPTNVHTAETRILDRRRPTPAAAPASAPRRRS